MSNLEEKILACHGNLKNTSIAKVLGCSYHTVTATFHKYGLKTVHKEKEHSSRSLSK